MGGASKTHSIGEVLEAGRQELRAICNSGDVDGCIGPIHRYPMSHEYGKSADNTVGVEDYGRHFVCKMDHTQGSLKTSKVVSNETTLADHKEVRSRGYEFELRWWVKEYKDEEEAATAQLKDLAEFDHNKDQKEFFIHETPKPMAYINSVPDGLNLCHRHPADGEGDVPFASHKRAEAFPKIWLNVEENFGEIAWEQFDGSFKIVDEWFHMNDRFAAKMNRTTDHLIRGEIKKKHAALADYMLMMENGRVKLTERESVANMLKCLPEEIKEREEELAKRQQAVRFSFSVQVDYYLRM